MITERSNTTRVANKGEESLWRWEDKKIKNCGCQRVQRNSEGQQKAVYPTLSGEVDSWSMAALTAEGIPCHFARPARVCTLADAWKMISRCRLSIAPFLTWINEWSCTRGPVSAPVINMWVALYQPLLYTNQRVDQGRKGANISSITPERHHGEMQIASQETPGDVKKKLAGRQQEANEYNGKCIQGERESPLYSYQLMQSYQWRCTVEGGTASNPPTRPLASVCIIQRRLGCGH